MKQFSLRICNTNGLHARPASLIVSRIKHFNVNITLQKNNVIANGKQILEIMLLAATKNDIIDFAVEGDTSQENEVKDILTKLFNSKFKDAY